MAGDVIINIFQGDQQGNYSDHSERRRIHFEPQVGFIIKEARSHLDSGKFKFVLENQTYHCSFLLILEAFISDAFSPRRKRWRSI